jgi:hypothetical protein
MAIFINSSYTFKVDISFKFLYSSEGDVVGVKVLPDDTEEKDTHTIVCDVKGRDFGTFSRVMEQATIINHVTGEPMARISILAQQVLLNFFTDWNLKDDETGEKIPINLENVQSMNYNLVKNLAYKWLRITSGALREWTNKPIDINPSA